MKRLVLRMVALGVVVVLGLIAIAQAQRDADAPAVASGPEKTAGQQPAGNEPADHAAATPRPEATPSPASLPTGDDRLRRTNPLIASDPPSGGNPLRAAQNAREPSDGRGLAIDPFARNNAQPSPTRRRDPQVLPAAGTLPAAAPANSPPGLLADAANRSRPLAGSATTGDLTASATASAGSGDVPISERVPPPRGEMLYTREPAPFKTDPLDPPTSIPNDRSARAGTAGLSASDRYGNSGTGLAAAGSLGVGEGRGKPGNKRLEGPQTPQITVEKTAPGEIQVGKEAKFQVKVRNSGTVPALDVEVHDEVPEGTRLIGTAPQASRGTHGELVWALGTIKPGEESTVEVQLMPTTEGEIGSVATVQFGAGAAARTTATKPELVVKSSGEREVLIGEKTILSITVSNPGSGVATGVVLHEHIPAGLQHPAGSDLEYEVGDLPPGESRQLDLTLVARSPGPLTNILTARGEGNLLCEDRLDLEVIAPKLDVAVSGPKRRYLEREATYQLAVNNPGTAPAKQVELVAHLPAGLEFVRADNAGHYEASDRTVHWRLEELPVSETGTVELVTMPVDAGPQEIRLCGFADTGLEAEDKQPVLIEGIVAILFEAVDVTDPIEVGGETTYEIRVLNQGSKTATNVELMVILPPELQAVGAEGPTRYLIDGGQVRFEGLARLAPKADTTYRVRAKGLQPGDLRVRVQLTTSEMTSPVMKEESTRVYADQ